MNHYLSDFLQRHLLNPAGSKDSPAGIAFFDSEPPMPLNKRLHIMIKNRRRSLTADVLVAFASVVVSTFLRGVVAPYIDLATSPFLLGFPAVIFSAWYGGLRPGTFATVFSMIAIKIFSLPAAVTTLASTQQMYQLILFLVEGFAMSFLCESLLRYQRKIEDYSAKIQESEEKYKLVVENTNDLISVSDITGKLLYLSPSVEKLTGHRPHELVGKTALEYIHPDDVDLVVSSMKQLMLGQKTTVSTFKFKHKRGHWIILEGSASPIMNAKNQPYLVVSTSRNITERHYAEEEVKEHLSLLNTVIEGITDAVFVKDLTGKYILINSAGANYIGKPAEEIIGKHAEDLFPPPTVKQIVASEDEALSSEKTVTYDEVLVDKNGKVNTYLSTKSVYRSAEGTIIGFVGISHNITERKKYEIQLEELNKRITTILESITDAFFSLDQNGKFVYVNKQAEKLLNVDGKKVIGKSVWDEFPEIIDSSFHAKYFRAIATQKPLTFEKFSDKHNKCFEIHAYPSQDGLSIYLHDITDRQEAIEALRENEERFRLLSESVPQVIWTAKKDGFTDYFNKRWYEVSGLSYDASKGEGWKVAIHPDDRELVEKEWKKSVKSGKQFEAQMRILHKKDKKYVWYLTRALPIRNDKKEIIKWFGTATDIHDQKKMDERKDEFISTASHELKTPITTIKAFTQLLQKRFNDKQHPDVSLYLYKMEYQINRLKTLINDLLDVSKIQAGKLEFFDKEFELDDLLQESIEDMQSSVTSHKIVQQGVSDKILFGDRYRIGQVINNLMSNAIKYSPKAKKIVIHVTSDDKNVTIGVQDFGIGIAPEEMNKIFDRFYRVNGTGGERADGMGLGLHIVGEIVRRHKGRIWVDSEEGKGSTFYVSFPHFKSVEVGKKGYKSEEHYEKKRLSN